jgi:hypothetical protein
MIKNWHHNDILVIMTILSFLLIRIS